LLFVFRPYLSIWIQPFAVYILSAQANFWVCGHTLPF
jgi:hypothetical protein